MQNLSAKLTIGGPRSISEKGCAGWPCCSPPLISVPAYTYFANVDNDLRTYLSPILTNRSGEHSFSNITIVEWTKEQH